MSTLPRVSKNPPSSEFFKRPQSDFDTGLNTSTAWTEHFENGPQKNLSESDVPGSLSDEELDNNEDDNLEALPSRPARTLYQFEGKAEFRELSTEAGDAIYVLKEEVGDGWSLVKNVIGEVGLLPKSYYTVCVEFKRLTVPMNNLTCM